jgi:hypothetical protein
LRHVLLPDPLLKSSCHYCIHYRHLKRTKRIRLTIRQILLACDKCSKL